MLSLEQRLDKIEEVIKKPSFRQNKGLGNEVGYYIFDYPAEQELVVRERIEYIRQKNEEAIDGFRIVVFDLYDIIISILKAKGYLEKCFEFEKARGFDRITKAVGNTLRLTSADSLIVNHIRERTPANSVVFITGIGKCYPLLRSHTVLNNLHQVGRGCQYEGFVGVLRISPCAVAKIRDELEHTTCYRMDYLMEEN